VEIGIAGHVWSIEDNRRSTGGEMTEPMKRILTCWHDHEGGVMFYITRHDEGKG
jgi:hypothetical protein